MPKNDEVSDFRLSVRLPERYVEELKTLEKKTGLTRSQVIRAALDQLMEKYR